MARDSIGVIESNGRHHKESDGDNQRKYSLTSSKPRVTLMLKHERDKERESVYVAFQRAPDRACACARERMRSCTCVRVSICACAHYACAHLNRHARVHLNWHSFVLPNRHACVHLSLKDLHAHAGSTHVCPSINLRKICFLFSCILRCHLL